MYYTYIHIYISCSAKRRGISVVEGRSSFLSNLLANLSHFILILRGAVSVPVPLRPDNIHVCVCVCVDGCVLIVCERESFFLL